MRQREEVGIKTFAAFAVILYVCSWFEAPLPAAAPASDMAFVKLPLCYEDKAVSKAAFSQSILQTSVVLEQGVRFTCFLRPKHLSCHKDGYGQGIGSGTLERSEDPAKRIEIDMVSSSIGEKTVENLLPNYHADSLKY